MNVNTIAAIAKFSPLLRSKAISVELSHCPPEQAAVKKALQRGGIDAGTANAVSQQLAQDGYVARNLNEKC